MQILLLRSLWTNGGSLAAALADVAAGNFDGVEGPLPATASERGKFVSRLNGSGVPFVVEIVTGGGYVPVDHSAARHLAEFGRALAAASVARPRFATVLAGCDRWEISKSVDFHGRALALARANDVEVCFETHRGRPTFNPWATLELLRQLPDLRLTCDFSHWCCVCERLVLDEEPRLLSLVAERARHIHARIGYPQGPQVPHPAAVEYREALEAHERWWTAIVAARTAAGAGTLAFTPEFGPDDYLQSVPFGGGPAATLDVINHWMAARLRSRFCSGAVLAVAGGA